jgi:hypothetical protein
VRRAPVTEWRIFLLLAVSSQVAERREGLSNSGYRRWQTYYMGKRHPKVSTAAEAAMREIGSDPQCHLSEMAPNETIHPHFHHTNQFQVMAAGSAIHEGEKLPVIAVHYGDHHTVFGDLTSGPEGLNLITFCAQTDPGGIYMSQPGAQALLRPTKGRSLMTSGIALSTDAVLEERASVALDSLFEADADTSDGLGAFILRIGAGAKMAAPDPRATGGQYLLVLKGSLHLKGADYPTWSVLFADGQESPLEIAAGPKGLEMLVFNFPRLEG